MRTLLSLLAVFAGARRRMRRRPRCRLKPKQVVTRFMTQFYVDKKVREAFETWVDPGYIQHNPLAATGRDAAVKFLEPFFAQHPDIHYSIARIIADGNLVAVHSHGKFTCGRSRHRRGRHSAGRGLQGDGALGRGAAGAREVGQLQRHVLRLRALRRHVRSRRGPRLSLAGCRRAISRAAQPLDLQTAFGDRFLGQRRSRGAVDFREIVREFRVRENDRTVLNHAGQRLFADFQRIHAGIECSAKLGEHPLDRAGQSPTLRNLAGRFSALSQAWVLVKPGHISDTPMP